ncbi:DNA topology modulation protein FlaR [Psychrobacillus vulpis]|uniref:DNA topology modulation protein FlaR n=1 Tax=Psychrobacillus vulpis TaxID=2325572 RepID=A0A544TJ57_9BACI|nr:DNA topology modulation protein FlaR [Psychrobacillus vulpis]TQR17492.1 DNA topology modulation protein FlaR [Psychrobacillus vulpis]
MKIYIVGSVGSGKTTFARRLSKTLDLPHYETDNFVWQRNKGGDIRNSEEMRNELFQKVILQEKWIIEGVHIGWTEAAIEVADNILFLDVPIQKRKWRIIKRYILQLLKLEKANYKPTFIIFKRMFGWNLYFEQHMKPEFLEAFNPHKEKVVYLKTELEMTRWIEQNKSKYASLEA